MRDAVGLVVVRAAVPDARAHVHAPRPPARVPLAAGDADGGAGAPRLLAVGGDGLVRGAAAVGAVAPQLLPAQVPPFQGLVRRRHGASTCVEPAPPLPPGSI